MRLCPFLGHLSLTLSLYIPHLLDLYALFSLIPIYVPVPSLPFPSLPFQTVIVLSVIYGEYPTTLGKVFTLLKCVPCGVHCPLDVLLRTLAT